MKNIVIIYDTCSGSTRDIALELQRNLRGADYTVVITSIDLVMDLGAADTVIIGSPLRFGGFTARTRRFLAEYRVQLSKLTVYYFATCLYLVHEEGAAPPLVPVFIDPALGDTVLPRAAMSGLDRRHSIGFYGQRLLAAQGLSPKGIAFFNGRLNLAKLSLGEGLIMRFILLFTKKQRVGDFVNLPAAAAWAAELEGPSV